MPSWRCLCNNNWFLSRSCCLKACHSTLSVLPHSIYSEDRPPNVPSCWQEHCKSTECVIQMYLKVKECCLKSQHYWPVATTSWSALMLFLAMSELVFILRAMGNWRGQEVKWAKKDMLGSFCQYWLFHIGFRSGAVERKVWRETRKMKLIFSMKAWPYCSCWEFWN